MRIRKRQAQLPFSWISPLSSDPNFNQSPVVQHPPRRQSPPPSDHPNQPIRRTQSTQVLDSPAFPHTTTTHGPELKKKEDNSVLKHREEHKGENGEKSNYTTTKNESVFGEELETGSESHQDVDPLKKRIMPKNNGKNKVRNGALMEGSRCSRVNGRGWRCCQQTLVGYSLCEHHLGKGRLRSITSVKGNKNKNAAKKEEKVVVPLMRQGSEKWDDVEKPLMKLGVVKARSISSLLGQNDNVNCGV